MSSRGLAVVLLALTACPSGETPDGGSGGGNAAAGGGSAGGATGGGSSGGGSTGGGSTGGGSSGGGTVAVDDGGPSPESFCVAKAQLEVAYQLRCGFLAPAQQAEALKDALAVCRPRLAYVDAGTLSYSGPAARGCLAAYDAGCRDFTPDSDPACRFDGIFVPRGQPGMPCASPFDCVSRACASTPATCGACVPARQLGEHCTQAENCDSATAFCSFLPAPDGGRRCKAAADAGDPCLEFNSCKNGETCFSFLDGGRRCSPLPTGSECTRPGERECGAFGYCRGVRQVFGSGLIPGACAPRVALGAACADEQYDDGCSDGGTCLGGQCVIVPPYSLPHGAACDRGAQCIISEACLTPFDGGAVINGQCVTRPGLDAGCGVLPCAQPLYCSNGACAVKGSENAPCEQTFGICTNNLRCARPRADAGPTCLPRQDGGTACEAFQDICLDGFCPGGSPEPVCFAVQPLGSSCLFGAQCSSGRCVPLTDGGAACAAACP